MLAEWCRGPLLQIAHTNGRDGGSIIQFVVRTEWVNGSDEEIKSGGSKGEGEEN